MTGDHQWIHVDVERAKDDAVRRDDRPRLLHALARPDAQPRGVRVEGFTFALNYGLNKVRFPAPLPVGGKVRLTAKIAEVEEIPGGAQVDAWR